MITRSGGSITLGTPGAKPSARPPTTSRIGYGTFIRSASRRSARAETSSRRSWSSSCAPKVATGRSRVVTHVRDLRNRVHPRHRRPRQARGDERNPRPARAGLGRCVRRGPGRVAGRRLGVIGPQAGDQPITMEEHGVTVVQNGEIYNYRELRRELQRAGHRFATNGDTEVLIHLYSELGESFVQRLRGMFALALWDAERGRLVLARDQYGIKPLYYRELDGQLAFASELRALPRGEIDLDALDAFLAFNTVPGPLTIFRDVRKLQAGHVLTWENGRSKVTRYARPAPVPTDEVRGADEAELVEELRARLRDSVRAHLVSDVPVGVLLSGGIDSSVLAALAAEEASEPLRTFSIGFEERSFNELADARLVAKRYGTRHRELVLRPDAARLLPALADAFDEPFADSSALPTYLVAQLAAEDVKVALSGEGGDELFGGYYT